MQAYSFGRGRVGKGDGFLFNIFHACGICRLRTELGLKEYIPVTRGFDYDMAAMNDTLFTSEFMSASGGDFCVCDCRYDYTPKGK